MTEVRLRALAVAKHFGGLAAVDGVSIDLVRGKLHAIVGPNGAGKSTLINLISGDLPLSSGRIECRGIDVSAMSVDRRSRLGIGRSYQQTNVFGDFTVFENCRLAAQSRAPRALHLFQDATRHEPTQEAARRALLQAGLAGRDDRLAATLSHGEQRQLEIAMVLATSPDVLLLDEPLAGMGADEAVRMMALIRTLVPGHAILVVEHDIDAVFAAADVITVMVNGQILETGTPDAIRSSVAVRQAYLGDDLAGVATTP